MEMTVGSGVSAGDSEDESGVSESEDEDEDEDEDDSRVSGVSSEVDFLWPRERAAFWSSMVIMRTW